ncbi:MAG TPA: hypothetical protein VLH08_16265 [Acidobacteriota bacterium]|nr:hypothetical protein [Acidobacteriota bacterium]
MGFARKEATIEAIPLEQLSPSDVEKKIIDGVKRYATKHENWTKATKNTPFLGQIIGMGIESANLVDITMSIERQFLTRKTKKVPINAEGTEFQLEDGELGKLMILEGQDTFAATPGLAVKMLMELGHMQTNPSYLEDVMSFAYVVIVGEGYRLNDSLQKLSLRIEKAPDENTKAEWLQSLREQIKVGRDYVSTVGDTVKLMQTRMKAYEQEKERYETLWKEIQSMGDKTISMSDPERDAFKSKLAALKLRSNKNRLILRVVESVAKDCGRRSQLEENEVTRIKSKLESTLIDMQRWMI